MNDDLRCPLDLKEDLKLNFNVYAFHLNIVKMNFNADLKREMFDLIKFNLIRLTFTSYMLTCLHRFSFLFFSGSSSKRLILLLFVCWSCNYTNLEF